MKRIVILALVAQLGGCNFAVKHPVATAAIVGGTIGLGTCAMESSRVGTCAVIGASTATFMGLVTAVALWTMGGGDDSHALVDPDMDNPEDGPADIQHAAVIALPPPVATPEPVVEPAPPPSLPPPSRD